MTVFEMDGQAVVCTPLLNSAATRRALELSLPDLAHLSFQKHLRQIRNTQTLVTDQGTCVCI